MPVDPAVKPLAYRHIGQPLVWLIPLTIFLISGGLQLVGDAATLALRFERSGIAEGELWRLLTGHLVHLGWQHLLLNLAGLGLVWFLVGSYLSIAAWLATLGAIVLCMDLAFWVLNPELNWYVGLSGVLHGLLLAGLVCGWRRAPLESGLLSAVVAAKLAWEQVAGALPGSELAAGGPVVVDAHLYGAAGGLLAGVLLSLMTRRHGSI